MNARNTALHETFSTTAERLEQAANDAAFLMVNL